jgi:SAM-dependent methyltransferase
MPDPRKVIVQFNKPTGWVGRLNLWDMNRRHSKLTDWGLAQVSISSRDTILDVGCGGGRTIHKLAGMAREGKVYGIDHADASVAASRKTNRQWIEQGRVEIQQASVSNLPFADRTFDLVTAVETHYYWPDIVGDLREVMRVLNPHGLCIIIAEAYKGGKHDQKLRRLEELKMYVQYSHLTVEEHREMFEKAGYSEVQVVEDYDRGWICAMGRRPA